MYRVWYSTKSFADYIVDHTLLSLKHPELLKMHESDASKPNDFHKMPDHIRKILYLDAPDLIVEKDNDPILSIEITTEAGTGHNAFQRFSRIAAAAENGVPAFYIYPEGAIIERRGSAAKWDIINPLVFNALESVMSVYGIPALLYYFPTDILSFRENPKGSPNRRHKGLRFDRNIVKYPGCPDAAAVSIRDLFAGINAVVESVERRGVRDGLERLIGSLAIRKQRDFMQAELTRKSEGRATNAMSPLSAVTMFPTEYVLNYLSSYEGRGYRIGELLRGRKQTAVYQVNAGFRGDPYPGCLAPIDYMRCREGATFEDRRSNLVLVFGKVVVDDEAKTLDVVNEKGSTIRDFFKAVGMSARHNLLTRKYRELRNFEIPRYMMQVRYGSTYSKVKHIRVYSYFADAIFFPDGALWRDA